MAVVINVAEQSTNFIAIIVFKCKACEKGLAE